MEPKARLRVSIIAREDGRERLKDAIWRNAGAISPHGEIPGFRHSASKTRVNALRLHPGYGFSEIVEQPLDVVELELPAEALAEAPAWLLEDAARALHVDLARHLHGGVVAVIAPAQ